jgi:deazaflavin-dependent oxidoreductase (nitroreductase family)
VDVQVEARRFRARARTASGEERTALWNQMVGIYAPYTEYQGRAEREIPVVVLDPTGE